MIGKAPTWTIARISTARLRRPARRHLHDDEGDADQQRLQDGDADDAARDVADGRGGEVEEGDAAVVADHPLGDDAQAADEVWRRHVEEARDEDGGEDGDDAPREAAMKWRTHSPGPISARP